MNSLGFESGIHHGLFLWANLKTTSQSCLVNNTVQNLMKCHGNHHENVRTWHRWLIRPCEKYYFYVSCSLFFSHLLPLLPKALLPKDASLICLCPYILPPSDTHTLEYRLPGCHEELLLSWNHLLPQGGLSPVHIRTVIFLQPHPMPWMAGSWD